MSAMRAPRGPRYAAGVLALVGAAAGCDLFTVSDPPPTDFRLTSDRTVAAPADSFLIGFEAEGARLLQVRIDYGDGNGQSFALTGSQKASGSVPYAYEEAGAYRVVGTLRDGSREVTSELTLTVEADPGG